MIDTDRDLAEEIADEIEWCEVRWLLTPHEVREKSKFEKLVASFKDNGWEGRPLLVEKGEGSLRQSWTGSHRIAAAKKAGLEEIPCYVLDDAMLDDHEDDEEWSNLERDRYGFWAGAGSDDRTRLEILEAAGEKKAAFLMRAEIEANEEDEGVL